MLKYSIGWRLQIAKFDGSLILKAKGHLAARRQPLPPGPDPPEKKRAWRRQAAVKEQNALRVGWGGGGAHLPYVSTIEI